MEASFDEDKLKRLISDVGIRRATLMNINSQLYHAFKRDLPVNEEITPLFERREEAKDKYNRAVALADRLEEFVRIECGWNSEEAASSTCMVKEP